MAEPHLLSVQVGVPATFGDDATPDAADTEPGKPWTSAIFKQPVHGPVWLGHTNLVGDQQADLTAHGGPDKAVNVYPMEHYRAWQAELNLPTLTNGGFGENFTTEGLLEDTVCIGDVYEVGEAMVQITQPRGPCWKIDRRWGISDLAARIAQTGHTGWYLRVLGEGYVEAGMPIQLIERPCPDWTVTKANAVIEKRITDPAALRSLAACAAIPADWRARLMRKIEAAG
jgi:MOSC domain-containing protein YiiM